MVGISVSRSSCVRCQMLRSRLHVGVVHGSSVPRYILAAAGVQMRGQFGRGVFGSERGVEIRGMGNGDKNAAVKFVHNWDSAPSLACLSSFQVLKGLHQCFSLHCPHLCTPWTPRTYALQALPAFMHSMHSPHLCTPWTPRTYALSALHRV